MMTPKVFGKNFWVDLRSKNRKKIATPSYMGQSGVPGASPRAYMVTQTSTLLLNTLYGI